MGATDNDRVGSDLKITNSISMKINVLNQKVQNINDVGSTGGRVQSTITCRNLKKISLHWLERFLYNGSIMI